MCARVSPRTYTLCWFTPTLLTFDEQGDFKIRAGEGLPAVTVHRSILAARSGFFRALVESGMGDANHGELTLKVGMHHNISVHFSVYTPQIILWHFKLSALFFGTLF